MQPYDACSSPVGSGTSSRACLLIAWTMAALVLMGGWPIRLIGDEPAESTIRVLSYNIRYLNDRDGADVWDNRKAAVISTIKQADLVGLQEVVARQLDDIRAGTKTAQFQWYGVGRNDGKADGEMTAVGWRTHGILVLDKGTFWLSPTPDQPGSRGWDAALPRIASWIHARLAENGNEFFFVNTHFDHRGQQARTESAKLLLQWIADHCDGKPVVVTGDFNATKHDEPIRIMLSRPTLLRNARDASKVPDPGPNSTWNGFAEIVPGRRIDFIFVSPAIQVLRFRTLDPRTAAGRFASDHLPVWAELQLP